MKKRPQIGVSLAVSSFFPARPLQENLTTMKTIYHDIVDLLKQGQSFVLATVFDRSGSAPRAMGARMVALSDGSIRGTIGGGLLEGQVREIVPEIFKNRQTLTKEFRMTGKGFSKADPEMICGGRAEVIVEYVDANQPDPLRLYQTLLTAIDSGQSARLITAIPPQASQASGVCVLLADGSTVTAGASVGDLDLVKALAENAGRHAPELVTRNERRFLVEAISDQGTVYIFGGGHIGQKLAPLCSLVGFKAVVLDDRPDYANREVFDSADRVILLDTFEHALQAVSLDENSYVVIVTRGHLHDTTVLRQVLQTRAGYIGMIGSRRKRDLIYQKLREEGVPADVIARVYSPIGVPIGGETPEEIAVSIAAEMIKVRAERVGARRPAA
jgi:xanthine dehydrogenase accessory factor